MADKFEVTLKPGEDGAATTALYAYAHMTGDRELYERLLKEGASGDFHSLPPEEGNAFSALEDLSGPSGTVWDIRRSCANLLLRPVVLICESVETSEEVLAGPAYTFLPDRLKGFIGDGGGE